MRLITMGLNAFFAIVSLASGADILISIDAAEGRREVSPWIYGRNNSLSDDPDDPLPASTWQLYREAGLRMLRENGGNNCTKYNWRRKLSSHPDWYNNVYSHDWDFTARSLQENLPGAQGMFALQLLGKVAANGEHNFNDWEYNGSSWWEGCTQNLAGGGVVNPDGGDSALTEGDPQTYLTDWPPDSATGILDHWFGAGGQGLDRSRFLYWNMDNEPEIWCNTHDDALPVNITAEEFVQKYVAVAKSARARFPGIKLVGFVACNEWQWYAWDNSTVTVSENGTARNVTWAEYFIKRIAEEQKASGERLLDIMDLHFYPGTSSDPDLTLQLHRIWFDTAWNYPKANGCKLLGGGWDEGIRNEFIMERCRRWLDRYMGSGHGVGLAVSECGSIAADDPNVVAVWYASQLGTFADHGVDIFTPWNWYTGQWEVLHLYSRYFGATRIASTSSLDSVVSAYASVASGGDSMTVILVNRDRTAEHSASVAFEGFSTNASSCATLRLSGLVPGEETFRSHLENALVSGMLPLSGNTFEASLPPLSVTAVIVTGSSGTLAPCRHAANSRKVTVSVRGGMLVIDGLRQSGRYDVSIYDLLGICLRTWNIQTQGTVELPVRALPQGRYAAGIGDGGHRRLFTMVR